MPTNFTPNNISVVVVDDDPDSRLCVKDVLRETNDLSCAGSFTNAAEAMEQIPRLKPNVALIDINLPDLNGIECAKRLKQILPGLIIVIVSGLFDVTSIEDSLLAGAVAFLIKPVSPNQFLATLRCALASKPTIQQKQASRQNTSSETGLDLTSRENEVMESLAAGLLYKEIADKLKISYSAVHKLQHKIFLKLKAGNRTEAISRWLNRSNR